MAGERERADWAPWMVVTEVSGQPRPSRGDDADLAGGVAPVGVPETPRDTSREEERTRDGGADAGAPDQGRRSTRREATRQRVLDAAREVFAERGVIGATVEDICDRARFTRGAFYSNFADKDDVLGALIDREHTRLLEHLDASFALFDSELAEAPDLATAVGRIVDRILASVPMDRQLLLVQTELEIHAIRVPELSGPFRAAEARFRERIGAFIAEAMERYGRELLVEPGVVVDAAMGVMERSVRRALLAGGGADPDAIARAIMPALLLSVSRPAAG